MPVIEIEIKANDKGATRTLIEVDSANERLANTLKNKLTLAASEAQAASARLTAAQEKLSKTSAPEAQSKLALEVNRAKVALDTAQDQADKYAKELVQLGGASKQASGGLSALKGIGGELVGALGFAGIATTAISAGKAMIDLGMKSEQTQLAFETLIGSTEGAQKHLDELRAFAAKTPFEFNDLTSASRKLQAFGFEAKEVVPMMTSMGNAVAAMGGGAPEIDRVTLAIGQMSAKGKIQAGEMMQLTEAGIPAWRYLAEAMGLTTAEVMKLSEKGLIPAEQAIQDILAGMDKDFGGMMEKQANTAAGAMSNLTDALTRYATVQGEKLNPAINKFATAMANSINAQTELQLAFEKGIITQEQYAKARFQLERGTISTTEVTEMLTTAQHALGVTVSEETSALKDLDLSIQKVNISTAEAIQLADEDTQAKAMAAAANRVLSAALSGTLATATTKYKDTITDTNTELAKARAELDKYAKLNGKVVTVTDEAKFSQAELTLQAQKLAEAQAQLSENTDPEKQAALTVAVEKASEKLGEMNSAMGGSRDVTLDYSTKIGEAQGKVDELTKKQDEAKAALQRVTLEFIYQKAAADLDAGAALELARSFGLIDEKSYNAAKAVEELRVKYDTNKDGAIDAAEAARGYTEDVENLGKAMAGIKDKVVTLTVQYLTNGNPNPAFGDVGLPGGDTGVYNPTPTQEIILDNRKAMGGPVYSGHPYWVGERGPEPFIPAMNGRILSVSQAQQALAGGTTGAPITININGAGDPRTVAVEVRRQLEMMGNRVDSRNRMGV